MWYVGRGLEFTFSMPTPYYLLPTSYALRFFMLVYVLFIIGFGLLIKGADWLVDGASSFAKKLKIPAIVIGLTIVAFGTSMPELIVNIFASAKGQVDLAFGNVIGSNISNILLILGISAIIYPLAVKRNTTFKEIPLTILAVVSVGVLANDFLIDKLPQSILSRGDGIILLLFFAIFLYYIFTISKSGDVKNDLAVKKHKYWQDGLLVAAGMAGLFVGGQWIVEGASVMARALGMSEALIGLTIVAVGTSLPELATSAVAAYKKQADIAVGNIVGSNIFNIFWILGVSAIIRPLSFSPALNFDMLIMLVATVLLFVSMFLGEKHKIERWQGVVFVLLYVLYIIALVQRG